MGASIAHPRWLCNRNPNFLEAVRYHGRMMFLALLSQVSASGDTSDVLKNLLTALNLGVAGVWVVAFVKGWIVPGKIYENEKAMREKADQNYRELVNTMQTDFLPELERGRNANQTLAALLEKLLQKIRT